MKLIELHDIELYDNFVYHHKYSHYMKTSMFASLKEKEGYRKTFLGFYEQETMIGSCLLLTKKTMFAHIGYIPLGPCIDYQHNNILSAWMNCIKEYAKDNNLSFLRIDPNVIRCSRDINGNEIDGFNNEHITTQLKTMFHHKGYNGGYDGSFHNRFTLIKELNDTILSTFAKVRQNAIKRHDICGVSTSLASMNELSYLMSFEQELSAIQGFKPHSLTFFKNIMECFKDNCCYYITQVNLKEMVDNLNNEINSNKYNKDKEALESKKKELENAKKQRQQFGDVVVIAAGLFIYVNKNSYDLYTYNAKDFNYLKPVDNLHYFAMTDLKEKGVINYDMCGFSGSTSPDDPYYGLYAYKKSFGSDFIEYIGEFDLILQEKQTKNYKKYSRLVSRIRRKIVTTFYKK